MNNKNIKRLLLSFLIVGLVTSSCTENFLEPTVSGAKDVNSSVNTLDDLKALMIGAYARMSTTGYYRRDYIVWAEVRSNNAFSSGNSGRFVGAGQFSYNATDANITGMWTQMYSVIANANIVIGATVENNESAAVKFVKGQAHAVRALVYMDILRFFGQQYAGGDLGVPLIVKFKDGNPYPERASVQATWDQIGADLEKADELMSPSFNPATKTEVTTHMVHGLQSRYYLYTKQYDKAAIAAKKVMDSGNFSLLSGSAFINSWASDEGSGVLFEMAVLPADVNSFNTLYFIYQNTAYGDVEVTTDLYDIYEDEDIRKQLYSVNGQTIRMTGKYPSTDYSDNIKVIRYAEVVLNYAEALARTNDPGALAALNLLPANRGTDPYAAATIDNVLLERRRELAMEGFGFFELVRNDMGIPYVDNRQTFSPTGIPFGSPQLALPIPQTEISANPNAIQNESY